MNVVTPTPLLVVMAILTLVSLFHTGKAWAQMSPKTHEGIRWSHLSRGIGLFVLLFACADAMQDNPYTWPWTMMIGTFLVVLGTSGLFVFSRRECHCPECPVREHFPCIVKKGKP